MVAVRPVCLPTGIRALAPSRGCSARSVRDSSTLLVESAVVLGQHAHGPRRRLRQSPVNGRVPPERGDRVAVPTAEEVDLPVARRADGSHQELRGTGLLDLQGDPPAAVAALAEGRGELSARPAEGEGDRARISDVVQLFGRHPVDAGVVEAVGPGAGWTGPSSSCRANVVTLPTRHRARRPSRPSRSRPSRPMPERWRPRQRQRWSGRQVVGPLAGPGVRPAARSGALVGVRRVTEVGEAHGLAAVRPEKRARRRRDSRPCAIGAIGYVALAPPSESTSSAEASDGSSARPVRYIDGP